MFRGFATKATKSPLALYNGIYNPPTSMSKRTAKRWSLMVQEKAQGTKFEKRNINDFVTEKDYVLQETDHHKSLESVVVKKFGLEPSIARLKILNGEIWVKNSMHSKYMDLKPNAKVSFGDTICAAVKKKPVAKVIKEQKDIQVENLKDSVLYKDDRIIVINKWNASVHGGSKVDFPIDTILPSLVGKDDPVPKLVHRLDKGTTGCLIFARTAEVAKSLSTLFQTEGGIVKRYVALVTPPLTEHLKQGESKTIVSGLVKHGEVGNEKMKMVPWKESFLDQSFNDVKKAITKVTVLKNRKLASLVCLEPITGRTHQLRVHMNTLHSFILGDYRYGVGCTKQFSHQVANPLMVPLHLHCYFIRIPNWFGKGIDLKVTAPLHSFWMKSLSSTGHTTDLLKCITQDTIEMPQKTKTVNEKLLQNELDIDS